MPKLPRVTAKIFAGNAAEEDLGQFGSALTGTKITNTDISVLQALPAFEKGWNEAVISNRNYPTIQEMNGIQRIASQQIAYTLQNGMPEWDSNTTYYTNQFCRVGKDFYCSKIDDNIGNNPTTAVDEWELWSGGGGSGSSRSIGETVFSLLPQSDAGLHLLDGALLQGQGIHRAFVSYIAQLYGTGDTHPEYFTTEEHWQASVTMSGVCGKFVYDSTAHTVRLPKVTGLVEGTLDVNTLGDLVQAGLPSLNLALAAAGDHAHSRGTMEITGAMTGIDGGGVSQPTATGAFNINKSYYMHGRGDTNSLHVDVDFYASRTWTGTTSVNGQHTHGIVNSSSPIFGRSNTVQPQTVKGFMYIVVANSTKTEIEVDIDQVVTDLNGKADTSLSNINETGQAKFDAKLNTSLSNIPAVSKELITGWGFPSLTKAIELSIGASGAAYTAPADGYIWLMGNCTVAGVCYQSVRQSTFICQKVYDQKYDAVSLFCPVSKGTFNIDYSNIQFTNFRFIYAKGGE